MDLLEASIQVAQLRKDLRRGLNPKLRTQCLGEWFDTVFLPSVSRPGSRKTHKSRFDAHIRPVLGDRPICQITRGELVALIDGLRPSPKCRRNLVGIKPATRNRVVDELKVIFRKLHDLELIEENISRALQKFRSAISAHESFARMKKRVSSLRLLKRRRSSSCSSGC